MSKIEGKPAQSSPQPKSKDEQEDNSLRITVLCGPPGAGKSTLGAALARTKNCLHLCTGDIFRDAFAKKTPLGLKAAPYMERGSFLPDKLVAEMVLEKLQGLDETKYSGGVLLDGYPRTWKQAQWLSSAANVERSCSAKFLISYIYPALSKPAFFRDVH
jgi:adenylate kinase family enzyme